MNMITSIWVLSGIIGLLVCGFLVWKGALTDQDRNSTVFNVGSTVAMLALLTYGVTSILKMNGAIPPAGEKPAGGCGKVVKMWGEEGGGGGNFLNQLPTTRQYYIALQFPSGEGKALPVDRDEYGVFKVGDSAELTWEKEKISSLTEEGEKWAFILKHGCTEQDGK